jgi:predicted HTH domain antitoxin
MTTDMTHYLNIAYDDSVLLETSLSREEFEREATFLLAAKLYELGRLSSGKAAELCGKERVDFLLSLQRIKIAMSNLQPEDINDEVAFARHRATARMSNPEPASSCLSKSG